MSEIKSLFSFSHDHFHGLMLAQMIKKNSSLLTEIQISVEDKASYTTHFYKMELENHFYIEENTLYPLIKGVSNEIDEIFQIIIEEHRFISMLVESLRTNADLEDKLDRIAIVLEKHIKHEERILFPKVKDSLSKEALIKLAEDLEKNGYLNIYKY